jgi:hypothetical protein
VTAVPPADQVVAPPAIEPGTLHRPVRAVVALVELIVAGFAVWGAFWAWPRGFATITTVISDGTALDSQRVSGNWLAAAIAFGTAAALLVIDAIRQVVLASRVRSRRARRDPLLGVAVVATSPAPVAATDVPPDRETAPEPEAAPATEGAPDAAPEAKPAPEAGPGEGSAGAPETRSDARVSGDE